MSKTKEEIGIIKNRKKREAAAKYAKEQRDVPAKKYAEALKDLKQRLHRKK